MKKVKINDDMSVLSHRKWNYKYYIVFTQNIKKGNLCKLRSYIEKYLQRLYDLIK